MTALIRNLVVFTLLATPLRVITAQAGSITALTGVGQLRARIVLAGMGLGLPNALQADSLRARCEMELVMAGVPVKRFSTDAPGAERGDTLPSFGVWLSGYEMNGLYTYAISYELVRDMLVPGQRAFTVSAVAWSDVDYGSGLPDKAFVSAVHKSIHDRATKFALQLSQANQRR